MFENNRANLLRVTNYSRIGQVGVTIDDKED